MENFPLIRHETDGHHTQSYEWAVPVMTDHECMQVMEIVQWHAGLSPMTDEEVQEIDHGNRKMLTISRSQSPSPGDIWFVKIDNIWYPFKATVDTSD